MVVGGADEEGTDVVSAGADKRLNMLSDSPCPCLLSSEVLSEGSSSAARIDQAEEEEEEEEVDG